MTEQAPERPDTGRPNTTGEPKLAAFASWCVLFASFGLSASTWIALARTAGFTDHLRLSGPFGLSVVFALSWLMPIAIDGYVVVALVLWTAPVPARVAVFARKNTYAAASVGVAAQSAYHSLMILSATHSPWRAGMAALVGALPPGVAALAVHMRALLRREGGRANSPTISVLSVRPGPAFLPPLPNTPDTPEPNVEPRDEPAANVRPITSARPRPNAKPAVRSNSGQVSESRADKLQRIKDAYPAWRTNMPSVRDCARVLEVAPSTAHSYQQDLVREANTPPGEADADDEQERKPDHELVGVG